MARIKKYKQYNLLLDPEDEEEAELIKWLESKHGDKHKNSYSTILKEAVGIVKDMGK